MAAKYTDGLVDFNQDESDGKILFPKSIIPTEHETQVVVAEDQIERGTKFGPYPGKDAVQKMNSSWMKYVTTVESMLESNLLICFFKDEMYFYCHRLIYVGTELVVWGGKECMHFDPEKWIVHYSKNSIKELTFACQHCLKSYATLTGIMIHCSTHRSPKEDVPEKNCECPHCSKIIGSRNHYRVHVLQHGINLSTETLYQKLKARKRKPPVIKCITEVLQPLDINVKMDVEQDDIKQQSCT